MITLAVVLKQGGRQSETTIPVNKSTAIFFSLDYYHLSINIRVSIAPDLVLSTPPKGTNNMK